jgi:hypothetical protein
MTAESLKEYLAHQVAEGKRLVSVGTPEDFGSWLVGSMERYRIKAASGDFDGVYADNLYRFIFTETESLFEGFDDDSPDNRANYAASLFKLIAEARGQGSNTPGSREAR